MNTQNSLKWNKVKLGNLLTLNYGKGLPARDRIYGEFPVYGSAGIVGYHTTFIATSPGIIVGRKGSIGEIHLSKKNYYPIDTAYYINSSDKYDINFMYFLLKTLALKTLNTDAAVPGLNRNVVYQQMLLIPDLPTQKQIAEVLSAYDDLIENNNRRIKILEDMAQKIYTEWFVNFRFPGHEKVKMIDSGTEFGKIPEDWQIKTIGNVLLKIESGSRPKGGINPEERGIPSIGAENINGLGVYDYSKEKFVSKEFFNNMRSGHIRSMDVLLYKDGAHIGRKSIFGNDFPHKKCCTNEHVFILRANELCSQVFLYFWLDQPKLTQRIKNLNTNAAQPGINQAGVRGLPIMLPHKSILDLFDEPIHKILNLIFVLAKQNNNLRLTRDSLIPQLVTGKRELK